MAIKGMKQDDSVSVYDPTVQAYREVSLEDFRKQLASFGMDEVEIEAKVKKLTGEEQ